MILTVSRGGGKLSVGWGIRRRVAGSLETAERDHCLALVILE